MNLVRADRIHDGVSLNLVRDLGMTQAVRPVGLAPLGGAGDGTDTALLAAIRNAGPRPTRSRAVIAELVWARPEPPFCTGTIPPARPVGGVQNSTFCGVGVLSDEQACSRRVCPGWRACRGVLWRCGLLPLPGFRHPDDAPGR